MREPVTGRADEADSEDATKALDMGRAWQTGSSGRGRNLAWCVSGLMAALQVACSPHSTSEVHAGPATIVSILPGGRNCKVGEERLPCAQVAGYLVRERHVALTEQILVVMVNDKATPAQHQAVFHSLDEAGYKHVGVAKVGFLTEPEKPGNRLLAKP